MLLKYDEPEDPASATRAVLETTIIVLSIVAQLASMAYKIAIEKDWIVVVAEGKPSLLASKLYKYTMFL